MSADVLVIGAGLAGLNAARRLALAGLEAVVLEAEDEVGGRVRTDMIDGFRVDRGFQSINPAYPALRTAVDVSRLNLASFGRGVGVRTADGLDILIDPTRAPFHSRKLLRMARRNLAGSRALAAWIAPAFRGRGALRHLPDTTLSASLDAAGVTGPLREQVLEPFLTGLVADDSGSSSANHARWLAMWLLRGTPGLPAQGMAALPNMLRSRAGVAVRLGVRVHAIERVGADWVAHSDGDPVTARGLVLATDPVTTAELVRCGNPGFTDLIRPPRMRGWATWWFATDEPPSRSTCIHVDGLRRGPVVNTAVISNVQPSYAPAGRHLIQASTLLSGQAPDERQIRWHVGQIYGRAADGWDVVAVHEIPNALTAIGPGEGFGRPQVRDNMVIAGDTADASIQGALRSGRVAARMLARSMAGGTPLRPAAEGAS